MIAIRCSALLFDLDGVLIDSTPAVARVWSRWAAEHGLDPETVVRQAHGRPSRSTIRELLPAADIEREDREVERREIEDLDGVVLLPGARELLNTLSPERWTIATSCTRPLAEVRLRAAGLPVDYQDVVPIEAGPTSLDFGIEPCKRRRDKSAPCKSLQPICTFTPLLRRRCSWGLGRGTTC